MQWTGWALHMVREAAEIDMRSKRMTERQQERADRDSPLDFGLIQSRLSRSLRLSVAMVERIRVDYLMRRGEREASGEQQRRRQRREQVTETVTKAIATPADGEGAEHLRSVVWETLVEDEILDAQLDTLSEEEFVQAVCRKIGRPPPSIPLPRGRDERAEVTAADPPTEAADREPAGDWSVEPAESAVGLPMPAPSKPDSS
ncbi:hypothetical protein [Inquilinus limosus]|nr:hypothetical protein [Inquilinus limosus]